MQMNFEPENGLALGAVETFLDQHYVHKPEDEDAAVFSKLALELEWVTEEYRNSSTDSSKPTQGATMRSPIVRGSPYTTMKYYDATPRLFTERHLSGPIVVDNDPTLPSLVCGSGLGNFSTVPVRVERELKIQFDTSDMTWLVFVSEPTTFECAVQLEQADENSGTFIPGVVTPKKYGSGTMFDLRATKPMQKGMVRVAMSNNCTTGQNAQRKCTILVTGARIDLGA